MKTVIGIQARSTSTRLPGKCLMRLGSRPMWVWSYDECLKTGYDTYMLLDSSDKVMISSVSMYTENIILSSEPLYRYRYLQQLTKSDYVVRVTADCPLANNYIIQDMINMCTSRLIPFMYNELDGMDVQVIDKGILHDDNLTNEEHVVDMDKIKIKGLYHSYKMNLSVDTIIQFDYIAKLVEGEL